MEDKPRHLTRLQYWVLCLLENEPINMRAILRIVKAEIDRAPGTVRSVISELNTGGLLSRESGYAARYSVSDLGRTVLGDVRSKSLFVTDNKHHIAQLRRDAGASVEADVEIEEIEAGIMPTDMSPRSVRRVEIGRSIKARARQFEKAGFPPLPTKRRLDAEVSG